MIATCAICARPVRVYPRTYRGAVEAMLAHWAANHPRRLARGRERQGR